MQKVETLDYEEQYKNSTIALTPFAQSSLGIVQSQTSLKVDTYTLACAPYQLSMPRTVLIGAFSKEEILFFQKYKGSLAGLTLSFLRANAKDVEKIFCRCQVSAIGLMKGREGVGLLVCDFKPIPPSLVQILGEHLQGLDRLQVRWQDLRDKAIAINPENSRKIGYNNFATMTQNGAQQKLALFSLAVNRLDFLMPIQAPLQVAGSKVSFNLFFKKYRFGVDGSIESTERLPSGVQEVRAVIDFSAELCELLLAYFYPEP